MELAFLDHLYLPHFHFDPYLPYVIGIFVGPHLRFVVYMTIIRDISKDSFLIILVMFISGVKCTAYPFLN